MDAEMMVNGVRAVVVRKHIEIDRAAALMGVPRSEYHKIMTGKREIRTGEFEQFCRSSGVMIRDALALGTEL